MDNNAKETIMTATPAKTPTKTKDAAATELNSQGRALLFTEARTHSHWQDKDVPEAKLREMFELLKMAPTSANCCPARFVIIRSKEGKEKLKPCLDAGNVEKTMNAPVTVLVANDLKFYEHLPKLFPHADA